MNILPIFDDSLTQAVSIIHSGGVIAHATETCYGLACDLTNLDAVKKLFAIKKRPLDQPVSALFSSVTKSKEWVEWNEKAEELAEGLPGPLTIILVKEKGQRDKGNIYVIPSSNFSHQIGIGIRISSNYVAQYLAENCDFPLSTTSANIHGNPNPYSAEEIVAQYQNENMQPNLILDSGVLPEAPSSTVVSLLDGECKILRQGSTEIS